MQSEREMTQEIAISGAMKFLLTILLLALGVLLRGWCTICLWKWFIVPFGAAPIHLVHALGLGVILTYTTTKLPVPDIMNAKKNAPFAIIVGVMGNFIGSILAIIGFGWIISWFM